MALATRLHLRVSSPCPAPEVAGLATATRPGAAAPKASGAHGAGTVFHCGACQRDVIDFTRVTEARARALAEVFGRDGLCGRIRVDSEGNTLFEGPRRSTAGPLWAAAAALATAACGGAPPADHPASGQPTVGGGECRPQLVVEAPAPAPAPPAPPPQDLDGDSVADAQDLCPDVPAGTHPDPGKAGCPAMVVVVKMGGMATPPAQIDGFAWGRAELPKDDLIVLDEVAKVLIDHPEILRVAVEGHASGDEVNPEKVSLARAQSAVKYLTARGVSAERLAPQGRGAGLPIVPNDSTPHRQQNRRIHFTILDRGP